jgi:hypothetical protein
MSGTAPAQLSFLSLVPTWQRSQIAMNEEADYRSRRFSSSSATSVSSITSLSSNDYGVNGYLVLTPTTSLDWVEEE